MSAATIAAVGVALSIASWVALATHQGDVEADRIASDEAVVVVPTVAVRDGDGAWLVPVHAWIFEPEDSSSTRDAIIDLFAAAIELDEADRTSEVFRARARWFLVDNERGKRLKATVAGVETITEESGADGHVRAVLRVPAERIPAGTASLPIVVSGRNADGPSFTGTVVFAEPAGIAVVSDIDDTIKRSEVLDRRLLLRNVFVAPPEAVPGMADLYRSWRRDPNAVFHYVTASPWQLLPVLEPWMRDVGFPTGSMHMKSFRWKDERFFDLFASPVGIKKPVVESLLAAMPARTFVLVGDSSESDGEIYGALARAHPGRIAHIFIRDITNEPRTHERWAKAFADVPAERFTIFTDASTLPRDLAQLSSGTPPASDRR
jgi:phosphatidate phosphatase APP1